MKFYDFALAPNPKRVRMFLAEKGLNRPLGVDQRPGGRAVHRRIQEGQSVHRRAGARARRRHDDLGVGGDLPLLRGDAPGAAAVRRRRRRARAGRNVEPARRAARLRLRRRRGPQHRAAVRRPRRAGRDRRGCRRSPSWAERGAGDVRAPSSAPVEPHLAANEFFAGDRFTMADITGYIAVWFGTPRRSSRYRTTARTPPAGTPPSRARPSAEA